MAAPLLQSTTDDIRDLYENYPSCEFFEHCSYHNYTADDISKIVNKQAAEEYAAWIYENEK